MLISHFILYIALSINEIPTIYTCSGCPLSIQFTARGLEECELHAFTINLVNYTHNTAHIPQNVSAVYNDTEGCHIVLLVNVFITTNYNDRNKLQVILRYGNDAHSNVFTLRVQGTLANILQLRYSQFNI